MSLQGWSDAPGESAKQRQAKQIAAALQSSGFSNENSQHQRRHAALGLLRIGRCCNAVADAVPVAMALANAPYVLRERFAPDWLPSPALCHHGITATVTIVYPNNFKERPVPRDLISMPRRGVLSGQVGQGASSEQPARHCQAMRTRCCKELRNWRHWPKVLHCALGATLLLGSGRGPLCAEHAPICSQCLVGSLARPLQGALPPLPLALAALPQPLPLLGLGWGPPASLHWQGALPTATKVC